MQYQDAESMVSKIWKQSNLNIYEQFIFFSSLLNNFKWNKNLFWHLIYIMKDGYIKAVVASSGYFKLKAITAGPKLIEYLTNLLLRRSCNL